MAKKTEKTETAKTCKPAKAPLDERTLLALHRQVSDLERMLDASSKTAAKQGGALLGHAASEHDRARGVGMVLALVIERALAALDEGGA